MNILGEGKKRSTEKKFKYHEKYKRIFSKGTKKDKRNFFNLCKFRNSKKVSNRNENEEGNLYDE